MSEIRDEYDIGAAFQAIENELIASMIRNMKDHKLDEADKGKQWSMWQAEQLKALEKYKQQNQKKYAGKFRDINAKIEALIRRSRIEGNMQQEIEILNAIKSGFRGAKRISTGGTAEFFRLNDRKLEALIKATISDMEKAETAVLRMANDQYRKIIFNAQVYANTGAGTYEKAVDMASKDMLAAGLNCVEYKNGARHTLADYADMAIRTASKRAYLQGEGEKRQEWGIPTVIVNKRGNPCPKCLPFCGKVFIDDVWSGGSQKDGRYPLLSSAVAAGLYHPRCRDSHTTYFPGISTADNKWTKEELEALGREAKAEARQQYAARQAKKFDCLSEHSLDPENREQYRRKAETFVRAKMREMEITIPDHHESNFEFSKQVSEVTDKHFKKSIVKGTNSGIIKLDVSSKQFGKKIGKHAQEYGLNPSNPADREKMRSIIQDMVDNSEEVKIGTWRGQEEEVLFHIKGNDVVLTKQNGEFITIMRDGVKNSAGVKNARRR